MRFFAGDRVLNVQKASVFVENNGTEIEKYRLSFLLGKERDDRIPLTYLKGLQNSDGGFPYNNQKDRPSCINATCVDLSLVIELGLESSDVSRKVVDYLFKVQRNDGSWTENEEIKQYDPPFWDLPNDLNTTMWLTANTASLLMQLGYRNSRVVEKAAEFLLMNRDNSGKFAGFLLSTVISIEVFAKLKGKDSDIVKEVLKILEENAEKIDSTWCLESLHIAGISAENPVAGKCIEKLVAAQENDGSWKSGDEKESAVYNTLNALKALRKYKIW